MNKQSMHGTAKAKGCRHINLGHFSYLMDSRQKGGAWNSWANQCSKTPISQCKAEEIAAFLGGPGGLMQDMTGEQTVDASLPAAYTFFAQFIDHDITLDTTTKLHASAMPPAAVRDLPNLRSASLDLDCLYGFGPEASPFMYAPPTQLGRLSVGSNVNGVYNRNDVPRNTDGRALIGDPRNDENIFVSQMQLLWIKFHNRLLIGSDFEQAQKATRYHYQWLVLNDFLKRVVHPDIYQFAKKKIEDKARNLSSGPDYPFCRDVLIDRCGRVTMPVEFSVAAYRFGHATVRSTYPVNADFPSIELFDERFGTLGFDQVPPELTVDWRLLLNDCPARAINRFLADELIRLPDPVVGRHASEADRSLAFRNLLRGYALGLPSGQTVAKFLQGKGYSQIKLLHPEDFTSINGWDCAPDLGNGCKLEDHTPLFFYLMHEAEKQGGGQHLGTTGSAILMEVFGAMLLSCDTYLTDEKNDKQWEPQKRIRDNKELTLASIVDFVETA